MTEMVIFRQLSRFVLAIAQRTDRAHYYRSGRFSAEGGAAHAAQPRPSCNSCPLVVISATIWKIAHPTCGEVRGTGVVLRAHSHPGRIFAMKTRVLVLLVLCVVSPIPVLAQKSPARVRQIILGTRHLGAHGMGYNTHSLWQLSKKLTPGDIPVLISLASGDSELRVGAQFALASQCGAAIEPVRVAAERNSRFMDLSAEDTLQLISEFEGCSPEIREQASAARADIQQMIENEHVRMEQEAKRKADDDARIQANGLKLLDPEQ